MDIEEGGEATKGSHQRAGRQQIYRTKDETPILIQLRKLNSKP